MCLAGGTPSTHFRRPIFQENFFILPQTPSENASLWVQLPAASDNPAAQVWSVAWNRSNGNSHPELHRGCWERSEQALPAGTSATISWLLRKLPNNQTALSVDMGTVLGHKHTCKCYKAASAAQLITNNVLHFPKSTPCIDQELLWLRITLNTSLAQLLPAPLITTSVFPHVSTLAALNYIASNTEVAHLKSRTRLTVLRVLLLLYLTCNSNFSSFFRIKQNTQKLWKTFSSHRACLPHRSHPT